MCQEALTSKIEMTGVKDWEKLIRLDFSEITAASYNSHKSSLQSLINMKRKLLVYEDWESLSEALFLDATNSYSVVCSGVMCKAHLDFLAYDHRGHVDFRAVKSCEALFDVEKDEFPFMNYEPGRSRASHRYGHDGGATM